MFFSLCKSMPHDTAMLAQDEIDLDIIIPNKCQDILNLYEHCNSKLWFLAVYRTKDDCTRIYTYSKTYEQCLEWDGFMLVLVVFYCFFYCFFPLGSYKLYWITFLPLRQTLFFMHFPLYFYDYGKNPWKKPKLYLLHFLLILHNFYWLQAI